jgi:hypothetical protein
VVIHSGALAGAALAQKPGSFGAVGVAHEVAGPPGEVREHGVGGLGEVAQQVSLGASRPALLVAGGEQLLVEVGDLELDAVDHPGAVVAELVERGELVVADQPLAHPSGASGVGDGEEAAEAGQAGGAAGHQLGELRGVHEVGGVLGPGDGDVEAVAREQEARARGVAAADDAAIDTITTGPPVLGTDRRCPRRRRGSRRPRGVRGAGSPGR